MNKKKKSSLVLTKYLGVAIALCGLGACIYGLMLFVAMPAPAVAVAMTGLILFNVGARKSLAADIKLNGKRIQEQTEEHTVSKPYRVLAKILFLSSAILIGVILPSKGSLDAFGTVLWWVLIIVLSYTYTALALFLCGNTISIIFAGAITWAAIILIARF